MISWFKTALFMAALSCPFTIAAQEAGIILIDQRAAVMGKVVPGDAPGFPVTITQSGSYRLAGNLTISDPNTTAIQILTDNVTLDLNGFSIIGPFVCSRNPTVCPFPGLGLGVQGGDGNLSSTPVRGIKVMNGTVRGMGAYGVRVQCEGCVVDGVYAESNGVTGIVAGDSVSNSVARRNGQLGIVSQTVRNSSAIENQFGGIGVPIEGGLAVGNFSRSNGGFGFLINGGATVMGNTASNNTGFGITAQCPSNITQNTLVGNQLGTIQTSGVCTVTGNAP